MNESYKSVSGSTSVGTQQTLAQESEYQRPYHHIPAYDGKHMSQTWYWSWGMRYLAGLDAVLSELETLPWKSLRDVGCGDGRFLTETAGRFPGRAMEGVDVSARAIAWARLFAPEQGFEERDITVAAPSAKVDVVTLVEVLEHIEPAKLPHFMERIADELTSGGHLIVTVPHRNARRPQKHFQHFSVASLRDILEPCFHVLTIRPMDRPSRLYRYADMLLGGAGHTYLITDPNVRGMLYRWYLKNCQFSEDERHCYRILAVAQKR